MNAHAANCYSRNAMLAQPVLHKIAMEEKKKDKAAASAQVESVRKPTHTRPITSKDLLAHKMAVHEQTKESSSSPKAKSKLVRFWQHIISQSQAPMSGRGAGGMARR